MIQQQKEIETIYGEYEKMRTEVKEKQDRMKELKDEVIRLMNEAGVDDIIINGWDGMMKLEITYPEREVLDKKGLAEALHIQQKDLNKPHTFATLVEQKLITSELIEQYTIVEERMQFGAKDVKEEELLEE